MNYKDSFNPFFDLLNLFAIACEEPEKYGKPISHWTSRELAEVMSEQGIVEKISKRHVGRLRERSNIKTSTVRILAQSPPDEKLEEKIKDICYLYGEAKNLRVQRERVISTDEMTGIQAKERKAPDKPMRPGQPRKREFEYIRHGTQTLIARQRCE